MCANQKDILEAVTLINLDAMILILKINKINLVKFYSSLINNFLQHIESFFHQSREKKCTIS